MASSGKLNADAGDAIAVVCLLALWGLMLVVAHPTGSFPLNDDWNYARSVKELYDHHRLLITQWSLAASLTHICLGYLFCLVGGFSFEALRICGTTFAIACSLISYALMRKVRCDRTVAFVSAAALTANPIFFDLANTFMTDVPFLALAAAAMYEFVALLGARNAGDSLANSQRRHLGVGTVLSVALCLSRQTGIVIPLAFALTSFLPGQGDTKRNRWIAGIPLFASLIAIGIFQWWLNAHVGSLFSYTVEEARLGMMLAAGPLAVGSEIFKNLLVAIVYLGLFLFPLLAATFPAFMRRLNKPERFFVTAFALEFGLLVGAGLMLTNSLMPLADNVLFSSGVGPILLPSSSAVVPWPAAPPLTRMALTFVSTLGAGMLCAELALVLMRGAKRQATFNDLFVRQCLSFSLAITALYISIVLFRGFFDRYLLFPMLTLMPFVGLVSRIDGLSVEAQTAGATWGRRLSAGAAVLFLAGSCWFSVVAVHDWFSWNRARWTALRLLMDRGISPMDIDGGLEFNGWYSYEPAFIRTGIVFSTDMRHNDLYVVAMTGLDGYEQKGAVAFKRWLPPGSGAILILKRKF